jgi:exonuclease V gamma subunit
MGQERYLPATGGRHLDDGAGALLVLARSLLADARALSEGHRSVRGWAEALASLLEVYLVPRDDVERRALDACLATVRELAARDLGGAEISYLLAKELVLEGLETAGSSSGGAVTGGVRVSTLAASRGLPARATFVVGLSEGSFPAGDRSEALDLRPKRPLPGDASAREKDEYLFLEALLCTGDRLVLSYVAREAASGEERNPSPVVVELLRLLDQGYLGRGPGAPQPHPLSIAPPLWPADVPPEQDALVAPSASAVAQRRLRAARGSLESLLGPIPPERTARELVAQLPAARGAEVARALGLVAPPTGEIGGEEEPVVRVSFSDLRAYLLCPLQGSARVRLHLGRRDEEEETDELLDRDDEVFSSSALTAVPLLKESLVEAWRDARDRAEALTARPPPEPVEVFASWAARAERRQAEGRLPAGVFLEAEQESANAALAEWHRAAGELAEDDAGRLEVVRFGPAREHERIEAILPSPAFLFDRPGSLPGSPLGSGIRRLRVELVGATNPLLGRDASLLFVRSKAPKPADLLRTWKPLLSAWLDRLALVASGAARPGPWSVRVAYLDGPRDYRFAPLEAPEAKSVLEGLLYDLTLGDNELLLPFEAVVELLAAQASRRGREAGAEPSLPKKGKPRSAPRPERSFDQLVTEALEAFQGRACQGPLRGLRAFRIPGEPEVERLLARRFEPLFGRLENPPAGPGASEEGES